MTPVGTPDMTGRAVEPAPRSEPARRARPILSLLVIGSGLLVVVSFVVPYFEPPFGGAWYLQVVTATACLFGGLAIVRCERGLIAQAALAVTVISAALLLFSIVFPWAYSAIMGLVLPD